MEDQWINVCVGGKWGIYGWIDGWVDGRVNKWMMDGLGDNFMYRWMDEYIYG